MVFFGVTYSFECSILSLSLPSCEQKPSLTQVGSLAGGLREPFSPQVLPCIPWGGTVGRRALQHEVLAAGRADDARWQKDIDNSLEQQ